MKNRIVKMVLGIAVAVLCLGGGYYLGTENVTEVSSKETVTGKEEKQETEKLYDTDLLAIVNMDEGVKKDGELISYSKSLLGTLEVSYEVTGIESAKQGLENGRYSAYLVLPGSFSESVESINDTPQKAVLEYAISQNLTEESLTQAIYSVEDAYSALNNGIGEMYLSSVLSAVHTVQDAVETIGDNDTKDLNALMEINGDDLREVIQLPELEKVEKTIDVLDLAPDYEASDAILQKIDETYQTAWEDGAESYTGVKIGSANLESKISGEEGTNKALENLLTNHGSEMEIPEYTDPIEDEKDEFDTIKNELQENLNDQVGRISELDVQLEEFKTNQEAYNQQAEYMDSKYKDTICALGDPVKTEEIEDEENGSVQHNQYTFYNVNEVDQKIYGIQTAANQKLGDYYNSVLGSEALKEALKGMYSSLTSYDPVTYPEKSEEEWNNYISQLIPVPETEDNGSGGTGLSKIEVNTYYPKFKLEAPDFSGLEVGEIDTESVSDAMDSMIDTSEKYTLKRNDYIASSNEQLKKKDEKVREDLGKFSGSYNSMIGAKDELSGVIQDYDPKEYLDTQALSALGQSLVSNQSGIEEKIGNQNEQYEEYVTQVYETSEENTQKHLESIDTAQNTSNEKLDTGLANAKSLKQLTYQNNQEVLDEIGGVLPYTRLGTQENILTYRYMVSPLLKNELKTSKTEPSPDTELAAKGIGMSDSTATKTEGKENEIPMIVFAIAALLIIAICTGVIVRKRHRGSTEDQL